MSNSFSLFAPVLSIERSVGFLILKIGLLLSVSFSHAASLSSIGDVSVPVKDESNEERWRASYQGLSEVLLRLTGDEKVLQSDQAKNLMKNNSRYLLRFGYESMKGHRIEPYYKDDYSNEAVVQNINAAKLKVLGLNFDYHLLVKDMQANGLPVWDVNRPELMFWWIGEEGGVRNILADGESTQARDALLHYSRFYGLPTKFPLMDMRDRNNVQTSDLWGLYVEQIAKANKRYGNLTWVSGKHYFSGGKWQAEWTLVMMGKAKTYRTSSDSLNRLQKTVIKHISGKMADEYAVLALEQNQQLILQVNKVNDLKSLTNLQNYLKGLFVIEQLSLSSIKGDQVRFKLELKESSEKLRKLLKLDSKLVELQFVKSMDKVPVEQEITKENEIDENLKESLPNTDSTDSNATQELKQYKQPEYPVLYYQWNENP